MKFKKKPIIIEAIQYTGTEDSYKRICIFVGEKLNVARDKVIWIPTLESPHEASPNDWIIKGIKGEFYPCKPDIFEQTYDEMGVSCWKCSGEDIDPTGFCKSCGVNQ